MAGRLQRWIIRWILVAIAIAAGVTGLGPMVLTQMVSGDALLATATEALGRPVVARSASVTGTAFQPPRLILSEPRVGTIDEALLQAATVEVDLGWPALLGRGSPVAVTIVDGLVDLTALPAEMPSNGGLVPASGQLPRIRFTGDLRLPNGLDLTAVNLLGTPAP